MKRERPKWLLLRGLLVVLAVLLLLWLVKPYIMGLPIIQHMAGKKTIADRVDQFGAVVHSRFVPKFNEAGVSYPPRYVTLLALKNKNELQVYAANADRRFKYICTYPILAASGDLGPKLKEGDGQVPEGIYSIESLNPNSSFHVSLRVGYPNAFDREMAAKEGRSDLGGDIMIHGGAVSVGCLAIGDPAAEDMFVMAAETGIDRMELIISPVDFRKPVKETLPNKPAWIGDVYKGIKEKMAELLGK